MKIDEQALKSTVQFAHAVAKFLGENKQASDAFQAFMFDHQNGSGAWSTLTQVQQISMHEDHISGIASAEVLACAMVHAIVFDDNTHAFLPPMRMQVVAAGDQDYECPECGTLIAYSHKPGCDAAVEPPFNENHHRYHTPNGPNPVCANCRWLNWTQP